MSLVVDASVALKWFVDEESSMAAKDLLRSSIPLLAPDLIILEVTNGVWKKVLRGEIESIQARTIAMAMQHSDLELYPSATFNDRALEIALSLQHPIYDCLYLACAEATGGGVVTADRRFFNKATNSEFASLIKPLGA